MMFFKFINNNLTSENSDINVVNYLVANLQQRDFLLETLLFNDTFYDDGSFLFNNFNSQNQLSNEETINKIYMIIYVFLFVCGFFSNFLVIYFVLFYKRMQTMTNKFITNLAVADLLVVFICIPVTIGRFYKPFVWEFGEFFCKFATFIQGVSLSVSVLTLTAISLDRYYIIYKPLKARSLYTANKVRITVILTWLISIVIMSPLLFVFKLERFKVGEMPQFSICIEKWPQFEVKLAYETLLFIILFILPIVFMSYAYTAISQILWNVEEKLIVDRVLAKQINLATKTAVAVAVAVGGENGSTSSNGIYHINCQCECHAPKRINTFPVVGPYNSAMNSSFFKRSSNMKRSNTDFHRHSYKSHKSNSDKCCHYMSCCSSGSYDDSYCDNCVTVNRHNQHSPQQQQQKQQQNEQNSRRQTYKFDNYENKLRNSYSEHYLAKSLKRNQYYSSANCVNDNEFVDHHRICQICSCQVVKNDKKSKRKTKQKKYDRTSIAINNIIYQLNAKKHGRNGMFKSSTSSISNLSAKLNVNNDKQGNIQGPLLPFKQQNENAISKLIRSRRRVVKLLIILVLVFVISWLPYHLVTLLIDFLFFIETYKTKVETNHTQSSSSPSVAPTVAASNVPTKQTNFTDTTTHLILSEFVHPITLCLALANSATNPICYCLFSHGFRSMFKMNLMRLKNRLFPKSNNRRIN